MGSKWKLKCLCIVSVALFKDHGCFVNTKKGEREKKCNLWSFKGWMRFSHNIKCQVPAPFKMVLWKTVKPLSCRKLAGFASIVTDTVFIWWWLVTHFGGGGGGGRKRERDSLCSMASSVSTTTSRDTVLSAPASKEPQQRNKQTKHPEYGSSSKFF